MPRVIVLGFDAADPRLVEQWISAGYLPNIARLKREGAGGSLRSVIQPISPAAWSTIITGLNPGKHGVFDWHERDPERYHSRIVNASSIKAPTLWQRANRAGLTSGVFNVPLTFPPTPLDGWMVTGILTPPNARDITYPAELRAELDDDGGRYKTFFGVTYQEGDEQTFLEALHKTLEVRGKALLRVLDSRPTDLVMAVFMESDHVMHYFWKYMDSTHPSYHPEYRRFEHAIRDVYAHLDSILGDVLEAVGPECTLFLLSDHGSGPQYGQVFINKLLMQNGLLVTRRRPGTRFKMWLARRRVVERLYTALRAVGLDPRPWIPKRMRQLALSSGIGAGDIDWAHTAAYVSGDMGLISVNLAGREGRGSVDPRDKEAVIDKVIAVLEKLTDEKGKRLVDNIWRASSLYRGAYLEVAPDIVFSLQESRYTTQHKLGLDVPGVIQKPRFGRIEISGAHALDGIFYAIGPGIKHGAGVQGLDLTQVAPTVLHSLGVPVSRQMDGQVIEALYEPAYLAAHPVQYMDEEPPSGPASKSEEVYDEEEATQVESRLRDLGYLG